MTGFPQGLRPPHWMGDLVSQKYGPRRQENMAVTEFIFPGSHDCATYGEGVADFSYECQEKNLYDQMMVGQRVFDLRLALEEGTKKFIPVHGIAKHTADDFNENPREAKPNDLATQIMKFAKEHPTEIIVLKLSVTGMSGDDDLKAWVNSVWNLLGERLLLAPKHGTPPPKYREAVESNRNIVFATGRVDPKVGGHAGDLAPYTWNVGKDTAHWMGDGDDLLWNENDWSSGEIGRVLQSTEKWMQENKPKCAQRDKFWIACMQLTPALGQSFTTFIKDGGSVRPKDLALGGGFGFHGSFKGSNQQLREGDALKKRLWRKHASCLMYDFADEETTGTIVAMNLPDDD